MTPYIIVLISFFFMAVLIAVCVEVWIVMVFNPSNPNWDILPFDRGQFSIRSILVVTTVFAFCCGLTSWDQVSQSKLTTYPKMERRTGGMEFQVNMNEFGYLENEWVWVP